MGCRWPGTRRGDRMTAVRGWDDTSAADALALHRRGTRIGGVLATTDHKVVGYLYLATSFSFFLIAGLMAMVIRAELVEPGLQVVDSERYNQMFTIHGTVMLLLFATPLFAGFANVMVPLQIGAPDVAFPRLNALSYWLFLFGGLMVLSGFLVPGRAAAFGWSARTPVSADTCAPGLGGGLWVMGLVLSGSRTIFTAVELIATIVMMRAAGMEMFRVPIFVWIVLLSRVMVL